MSNQPIELSDVFHRFYSAFRQKHSVLPSHEQAAHDIMNCMTAAMGGGFHHCNDCEELFYSYHGCRNRSCPKCHGRQTAEWLAKRQAEAFPCQYFHVIATVPSALRDLFKRHQKIFYGILMQSAARAVCELASDRHYIGAEPGILAILHTWTTLLFFHPHVHMLVTGGGVDGDRGDRGGDWRECSPDFLVPVKKLSRMISKKFSETLLKECPELHGQIPKAVWKREWCSFCKPFGTGQEAVLKYLARYVFRIAITNARILAMDESNVTLRCKDNETGEWKVHKIPGVEFLRRFLQHVLPHGFHKVRYYGLWSPAKRKQQLQVHLLLAQKTSLTESGEPVAPDAPVQIADLADKALQLSGAETHEHRIKCPKCASSNVECLQKLRRGGHVMQT